jgi:hypothetical protein
MPPLDSTIGVRLKREAPVTHPRDVEDGSRNGIVLATVSRRVGPRPPRSRCGSIKLEARADSAVAPDQVFIPFRGAEAAASVLTNRQLDPCGYKFCAACVGAGRGSRTAKPNSSVRGDQHNPRKIGSVSSSVARDQDAVG